jgi:hypothetical protein
LIKSNESKEEESSQKFKDEVLSFIKFRENAPPISCNNKFLSAEEKKSKFSLLVHNCVEVQTKITLKTIAGFKKPNGFFWILTMKKTKAGLFSPVYERISRIVLLSIYMHSTMNDLSCVFKYNSI